MSYLQNMLVDGMLSSAYSSNHTLEIIQTNITPYVNRNYPKNCHALHTSRYSAPSIQTMFLQAIYHYKPFTSSQILGTLLNPIGMVE